MSTKSLHFSDEFAISCGTVSIDIKKHLLLAVLHRPSGEYMIPKGRKNVGEALEKTALRETLEETGYRTKLLPHALATLATSPRDTPPSPLSTEPFAMCQRLCHGTLKIIFWYAAEVNYEDTKIHDTQDEGEDFDTVWISFDDISEKLSFEHDRKVAMRIVDQFR